MLDTSLRAYVAGVLRAEAHRRQLSQKEIASRLGVSPMWVSGRFTGKIACDVDDLALLASVFGMHVRDLLPEPARNDRSAA